MKKIVIYIFIFVLFLLPNFASATSRIQTAEISKIETNLFGFDYVNDELTNRIARLENAIYGKESTGDLNKRVKKIASDIMAGEIGLEIEPTEDTFKEQDLITDSTVNYPILDEIETKVFNKTYKNKDFHSRIVGIERELFGKIYDVEDYSTRMDRIKSEVVPERLAREKVFGYDNSDNTINSIDLSGLNANRFAGRMPYGQENYTRPYANYGDYLTPESSSFDDELARLEQNTFGTEFSNDDTQTRMKRLNSVNKAKKSYYFKDTEKVSDKIQHSFIIKTLSK